LRRTSSRSSEIRRIERDEEKTIRPRSPQPFEFGRISPHPDVTACGGSMIACI
jgi:hypothetical protein